MVNSKFFVSPLENIPYLQVWNNLGCFFFFFFFHNENGILLFWFGSLVVLGRAYRGLTGGFLLLRNFSVTISVSPHVCFILV